MKILIADDERPAREELCFLLTDMLEQPELSQASDGDEALSQMESGQFDVVFLDIQMPGKDGLAVASKMLEKANPPHIVFATAYSEHAVEAFRLSALDYLVKPIREERLKQTLQRLPESSDQREGFQQLLWTRKEHKLWAETDDDRWVLLDYKDIQYVMAQDKKVYVCTDSHPRLRIKRTLKELEKVMGGAGFLRVHKGYLVNLSKVKEMSAWFSGSYTLIMDTKDKAQVPLSRRFAGKFRETTGW